VLEGSPGAAPASGDHEAEADVFRPEHVRAGIVGPAGIKPSNLGATRTCAANHPQDRDNRGGATENLTHLR
jgi:hypothetical protein